MTAFFTEPSPSPFKTPIASVLVLIFPSNSVFASPISDVTSAFLAKSVNLTPPSATEPLALTVTTSPAVAFLINL